MSPGIRGALKRVTARAVGSRFAKPIARVALVAAGLLLLALIGHTAVAGALGPSPASPNPGPGPLVTSGPPPTPTPNAALPSASASTPTSNPTPTSTPAPTATSRIVASPDDPVIINTATSDDLRRLPGIGDKRASAILALRARLGRFRAIEDLLQVKGIGRATLKRLRPLVRLYPVPADAGGAPPVTTSTR